MELTALQDVLSVAAGALVGFSLGLVGGGGSILAVPLMVYLVGIDDPHVAIGTSALAVAANAAVNLANHARSGNVKWRCACVFASVGVAGALLGSTLGKAIDGQKLLALFAMLMILVAGFMMRKRSSAGDRNVRLNKENAPKLTLYGFATGLLSGFFGIGGGFLVVPGLIAATGMPILFAVGSSLVAVTAFGVATAFNYAYSGWVDWLLATTFIGGGVVGGWFGARLAVRLSARRGALNAVLAALILTVGVYTLYRSVRALAPV